MTMPSADTTSPSRKLRLHRAMFRLHFYAGIIVAPFVLILAITGSIYLFNTEIDDALHPGWRFVHEPGKHLNPEEMVGGALAAFPGATPTRIDLPMAPDRTAVVFLTPQTGEPVRVYVDPVTGEALGSFIYARSIVGMADNLHGSLMMGDTGDLIVELAACWAIVLIISGFYLWWPRSGSRIWGVFLPRKASGRLFWRDIHAIAGIWVSVVLLFLLITGLPWAANWGGNLERAMASLNLGYPASYRTHVDHAVMASRTGGTLAETTPGIPWTLEPAPAPHSGHAGMHPISVGQAVGIFAAKGLTTAYRLIYPADAHDVFTAYTYPDRPEGQRTIHLDQYSGEVINDVAYADYGVGAKAVELGVALHMGNYFGIANQFLMLFAALGAAALSLTGPIMWLKRRKVGLGAPKALSSAWSVWAVSGLLVAFGIVFPALGISVLTVFALEKLVLSRVAPVRDWFGLAAP